MAKKPAAKKTKKKALPELTPQQILFCLEYLKDMNGKQAAIRAGYSEKTAESQASRMLKNVKINDRISAEMRARTERVKVDADYLLRRLHAEAEADLADLYNDDGTLKPVREWPAIWRKGLVSGLKVEELFAGQGDQRKQVGIITEIKHADRAKRLHMLGLHTAVQAFNTRVLLDASDPLKRFIKEVSGRSIRPAGEGGDDG